MITLNGIKDFIKTLGIGEHFSVGRINPNLDKSLGVYSRDDGTAPVIPVGGLKNKGYDTKQVTILVHWTNNAAQTEDNVLALYDALLNASDVVIDEKEVKFIRMSNYPINVSDPDGAVYEYVIQCDFITER